MKFKGSLQYAWQLATCPYPESDVSYPHSPTLFSIYFVILSSHLYLGLPSGLFSWGFLTNKYYLPCSSHLPLFGKAYTLRSSTLCNFLLPPLTSSLLNSNIFLSTVLTQPQSTFFPQWDRSNFTSIQAISKNYSLLRFNL